MSEKKPLNPVWTAVKPFLNGGLAGMGATCVIQPVDMVKVLCYATTAITEIFTASATDGDFYRI